MDTSIWQDFAEEIREAHPVSEDCDLVVEVPPGDDVRAWEAAGATWVLTSIKPQPDQRDIREVIEAGP